MATRRRRRDGAKTPDLRASWRRRLPWILGAIGLVGPAGAGLIELTGFSGAFWTATIVALGVDRAAAAGRRAARAAQTVAYLGFAVLALGKTVGGWPIGWVVIWRGLAVVLGLAGIPNVTGRRSRD